MIKAQKSPALERAFIRYTSWYLKRNFHTVHLLGERPQITPEDNNLPLLVCLNHSSWWDVLLGLYVASEFFERDWYAVMDERQLMRYRFFSRLGMIGVDRTSLRGAKEFMGYAEGLLKNQPRALWLTSQGEMVSNLVRPVQFQPGVGYLAEHLDDCLFTTVAFQYEFWNEKLPEAFVSLSPITRINSSSPEFDRRAFVKFAEQRMEQQIDALLKLTQKRDSAQFQPILKGGSGISTTYDALRALSSRLRGERFRAEHSDLSTPQWKQQKTSSTTSEQNSPEK